jgi:hypothetical protein
MEYLIIGAWDTNYRPTRLNIVGTEDEAISKVTKLHSNGHVGAFYYQTSQAKWDGVPYMTVDPVAKTVSYDTAAEEAASAAYNTRVVQNNRRSAYQAEADTLFFEEQAGEVAAGTWAAKRAEIKARFPK